MNRIRADRTMTWGALNQRRCFRASGAILSVGAVLVLVIGALAAGNPAFHLLLHPDAKQASHQCYVRLVENHQLITPEAFPVVLITPASSHPPSPSIPDFRPTRFEFLDPPGRAPPVA